MSNSDLFAEQFEAYLDGTLPESLRAEVERRIAGYPDLHAEVELARRINASLRARFAAPTPAPLEEVAAATSMQSTSLPAQDKPESFWKSRRGLALLAIVASIAWALFIW